MTDTAPTHSKLSPSKAYQWTVCTASIGYIAANNPPDESSPAAIEGTNAHTVAECYLLGKPIPGWATKDMKMYGKEHAELCREAMGPKQHLYDWGVEHRVPLYYLPKERGTVDFFCVNRKGVHLIDYKYGYGVVDSVNNKQMAIYAVSIITENKGNWDWPRIDDSTLIHMTINQPRVVGDASPWTISWGDLKEFVRQNVNVQAETILATPRGEMVPHPKNNSLYYKHDPRVVFAPSDSVCKFCPMEAKCEARNAWLLQDFVEMATAVEEDKEFPPVGMVSDARLVEIHTNLRPRAESWFEAIEKYLKAKVATTGLPGLKMVLSKGGHRYWSDEKAASQVLMGMGLAYDEVYAPPEILTPAQAEKLTKSHKGKKQIELHQLMVKPRGSPVMVPESDPRPAHVENARSEFSEILDDWA